MECPTNATVNVLNYRNGLPYVKYCLLISVGCMGSVGAWVRGWCGSNFSVGGVGS